jgi:rSAM/selenodomain-associated transferase 1
VAEKPGTLMLFARAPVAGGVKTRLAGVLGFDGATRLYRAFLEDAARIYANGPWEPVLYAEPDPEEPSLAAIFGAPWRREAQVEGDLGRRLSQAFRAERSRGAPAVLAVGSDHPALERASLVALFEAVRRDRDAAVIPARDGGYCAIALSAGVDPSAAFDGIPWSSADTLAATLERMGRRGVGVAVLDPGYDVDRPEDLERLRLDLARRDPKEDDYPHSTAVALAELAPETPA